MKLIIETLSQCLTGFWQAYNTALKAWPGFLKILFKLTVCYVGAVLICLYAAAWYIYGLPLDTHPFIMVISTFIGVLGLYPTLVVKFHIHSSLPPRSGGNSIGYDEIIADAWFNFCNYHQPYFIVCAILIVITLGYLTFVCAMALKYRHHKNFLTRALAYGTLALFCIAGLALLFKIIIPFVQEVHRSGFSEALVNLMWRIVSKFLNLGKMDDSGPRGSGSKKPKRKKTRQTNSKTHQTKSRNVDFIWSSFTETGHSGNQIQTKNQTASL